MNEADHKAFEYWWPGVPKINFAGTESEKNAAEAGWLARAAHSDKQVAELVQAVERLTINDIDLTEVDALAAKLKEAGR